MGNFQPELTDRYGVIATPGPANKCGFWLFTGDAFFEFLALSYLTAGLRQPMTNRQEEPEKQSNGSQPHDSPVYNSFIVCHNPPQNPLGADCGWLASSSEPNPPSSSFFFSPALEECAREAPRRNFVSSPL
jgi:hypothetical protein